MRTYVLRSGRSLSLLHRMLASLLLERELAVCAGGLRVSAASTTMLIQRDLSHGLFAFLESFKVNVDYFSVTMMFGNAERTSHSIFGR